MELVALRGREIEHKEHDRVQDKQEVLSGWEKVCKSTNGASSCMAFRLIKSFE